MLTRGNSGKSSGFSKPQYDARLARAARERSAAARNSDYNQAEQMIADEVPIAPIYQYTNARLISPRVKGYPINNPEDVAYSREMWIEQLPEKSGH